VPLTGHPHGDHLKLSRSRNVATTFNGGVMDGQGMRMTAKAGQSAQSAPQGAASCFRTAVVPAAGLGTRFLPATKTVPKELLPVVDTPGIELVASEAADSGAQRLVIVTSPGKDGVVAHFVEDLVLESTLAERGKFQLLE